MKILICQCYKCKKILFFNIYIYIFREAEKRRIKTFNEKMSLVKSFSNLLRSMFEDIRATMDRLDEEMHNKSFIEDIEIVGREASRLVKLYIIIYNNI
jgi:hypothetical protein